MRLVEAISTAVLSLILVVGVPAYAQQEQHEREENKEKPAQEHGKDAKPEKAAREQKDVHQQQKDTKSEEKHAQHTQAVNSGKTEEHSSAGVKGRIPEDRFRSNFGRDHRFRVSEADYRRDRRFQYGGYWFGFVQAWPSNWLYTQEVYVVEIDGVYYLCNAEYPGVNITLNVIL